MVVLVCVVVTVINIGSHALVYVHYSPTMTISKLTLTISKLALIILRLMGDFLYALYLIFCIFTYVVIFITILESRRNAQLNNDNDAKSTTIQFICDYLKTHGYTAPFLITLTYAVFVTIPCIVETTCMLNNCSAFYLVSKIWRITYSLNDISDVLIYVYFDRDIRNHLKKKFTRRSTPDDNYNNSNTISQTRTAV